MSFGRNPHVAKAEAAEQKALAARDAAAYEQAWREAARQWERAAAREKSDKRKVEYEGKAEAARANADTPLEGAELEPEREALAPARIEGVHVAEPGPDEAPEDQALDPRALN